MRFFFELPGENASAPRNLRDFPERCAPWGRKDAAHGASDNSLVIRRGLEPREPSRAPLDRSCLLPPSCPAFVLFWIFFRLRVQSCTTVRPGINRKCRTFAVSTE